MSWTQQGRLALFVVLLWTGGVWGAKPLVVSVPSHTMAVAYGQAFYLLTETMLYKLSLSGNTLWQYRRDPEDKGLFVAFDMVYLYGDHGLSQIDAELGVKRWMRPFPGLIGLGHHYPYLVVYTPSQTGYVHPSTGMVITTVDGSLGASEGTVTENRLTSGRTCLEKGETSWQLKGGVGCQDLLFDFPHERVSGNIEAYLWMPPTLSLMTASELVFWPYTPAPGRAFRDSKGKAL